MAVATIAKDVFETLGIGAGELPKAAVEPLPLDEAKAGLATRAEQGIGPTSIAAPACPAGQSPAGQLVVRGRYP